MDPDRPLTDGVRVPLFDGARGFEAQDRELLAAAERVLRGGRWILGPEVERFEREVAAYLGTRTAVGVASGTDALMLALRSIDVGPGDAVLTTPFTFFATVSAIVGVGATPVFADIDPATFTMDPAEAARVLRGESGPSARTGIDPSSIRAILPVHLFGHPADMEPILGLGAEHGVPIVEDVAQAMGTEYGGRRAGSLGALGCLSFFPTKNLGGFGDGGMVVTDDELRASSVRQLARHGSKVKYLHERIGTNSRLDELQAALLSCKLRHLDDAVAHRRAVADRYSANLDGLPSVVLPVTRPGVRHTFHQYVIRVLGGGRDRLKEHLAETGVETAVHYPVPAHLQEALADQKYRPGDFPISETASRQVLSLPMSASLTDQEQGFVVDAVRSAVEQRPPLERAAR
jgi:dTDP-4-amino-4,6-dideoxygalactose transaminase